MKKTIILLLTLVLSCSLFSCGDEVAADNVKTAADSEVAKDYGDVVAVSVEISMIDKELMNFGLCETDIKPEGAPEAWIAIPVGGPLELHVTYTMSEGAQTAEQKRAWMEKMADASKAVADDGKIWMTDSRSHETEAFTREADISSISYEGEELLEADWCYYYDEYCIPRVTATYSNGVYNIKFIDYGYILAYLTTHES